MEANIRNIVPLTAIVLTALSAGLFYAWTVSVIPGTRMISDKSYIETMQHINRAIINPWFMIVFIGPIVFNIWSTYLQFQQGMALGFWMMLAGSLCYLLGTFGVTVVGNVPLNYGLELVNMENLTNKQLFQTRAAYESPWNKFHLLRTLFAVAAFLLMLVGDKISQNI